MSELHDSPSGISIDTPLFANCPDPMWIFDLETWHFLEVNESMVRRYGYSREELLGEMTIADIRPPEEEARLRDDIGRMRDNYQKVGVYRHRTRAGELVDMEIATYSLVYNGRKARLVCATDLGPVRRPRGSSSSSEVRENAASELIEAVDDIITRFDSNWRFLDANRVLMAGLKLSREQIVGRELWELLPQLRGTDFERYLREAMVTRRPVSFTALAPTSQQWFENYAYPIGDGLTVITRNIHEHKQTESRNQELRVQLSHAQRMETLGEMVSGLAHDFNNLLTIMAVSTEQLKSPSAEEPSRASALSRLDAAIERAAELSRRLLAYSRSEPERFAKTDVNRCIAQTLTLLAASTDRRIELVTSLDRDCHFVLGDAHELEHVFMNLIINACDALAPRLARSSGGRVQIKTWRGVLPEALAATEKLDPELDYLCILFEDNGEGMPEAIRGRVFEPFFTTKPENRGTGLGLSIAHSTIRAHRGAITVESEPGVGTRFLIYLPVYRKLLPEADADPTHAQPRARARLLVVEDEEHLRELLEEMLRPLGYEVTLAENGRRGVELFSADPNGFDAVLLDLNMPGLNGVTALRAIRAVRPSARVLMMTGYASDRAVLELGANGPQSILHKPYHPDELQRRLSDLLSSSLC